MKKTWIFAVLGAAMLFTACAKKVDHTEPAGMSPAVGTTMENTTDAAEETTGKGTEPETKPLPGKAVTEGSWVDGIVKKVAEDLSSITVTKEDGKDLEIQLSDVDIEISDEFKEGMGIMAVYAKDKVPGTDAPILIIDAQKDMKTMQVSGSVVSQAMSSFTIKTSDGEEVGFLKANCPGIDLLGEAADESNGSGAEITVTYVNVIYADGGNTFFPIMIEEGNKDK